MFKVLPESIRKQLIQSAVNEARSEVPLGGLSSNEFVRALCDALQRRHNAMGLTQGLLTSKDGRIRRRS